MSRLIEPEDDDRLRLACREAAHWTALGGFTLQFGQLPDPADELFPLVPLGGKERADDLKPDPLADDLRARHSTLASSCSTAWCAL